MSVRALDRDTRRLAAVVVVGAFLSTLEASVVAVGLESIAGDLGVGLDDVAWVTNAYLLALAVSLPASGWLGRRVGVGRVWLVALGGFTATSLMCALAGSLALLVGARSLQGLAAGVLVPAGQTLLGQAVGPDRLGRVMGMLGLAVSAGPALGPALGGLLLETLSWPWLFGVQVPIGLLGLLAGAFVVPRGDGHRTTRPDLVGWLLVSVGLPATLYALTAIADGRSVLGVVLLLGGIAALAGFVVHSRRTTAPLTDLRLLRDQTFRASATTAALFGAVMFSSLVVLPLWFQLRLGAGVAATGLALVSFGVGTAVAAPFAGALVDRVGPRPVAVAGTLVVVATTVPFALLGPAAPTALVQGLLVLRGASTALAALPPTVAAYAAVPGELLPDATTQLNALQRVGGAAGTALIALVVAHGLASGGPPTAFTAAFLTVTALGLAAGAAALRLPRTNWTSPKATAK